VSASTTSRWATGLGNKPGAEGRPGTFAEFAAVDQRWLHPIPEGVSDADAVALFLVGVTAQLGLVRHANLKAGEILFVNGGSAASAHAWCRWPRFSAHASSPRQAPTRRSRPAAIWERNLAINYKTQDVVAAIKGFAPEGVNVWWESLREPDFDRTIALLATRGG